MIAGLPKECTLSPSANKAEGFFYLDLRKNHMQAFRTLKLRFAALLALSALAVALLAPIGKAEAYGSDSSGVYRPQVSWNSGPQ